MDEKIGNVIKKIRRSKGLSGKFVSERLGIDPSTLSKYESNMRKINAELLPTLAEVLGVKVEDFFKKNVGDMPTMVIALTEQLAVTKEAI